MTIAFFTIGQAGPGLANFFGFSQHFLGQVALNELPVMLFAAENVGQGQEHALLCAVLVQGESGDTDDVGRSVAAQDVRQHRP